MREFECEDCGQRVIELRGPDGMKLILDWHASPAGNIVIKGHKATVLRNAKRARKFLELAGVPDADRYLVHACWGKKKAPKKAKRKR
jgi:hypothetical protein